MHRDAVARVCPGCGAPDSRRDLPGLLAQKHWQLLVDNIAKGAYAAVHNQPVFSGHEVEGVGTHEAPRGTLSHWVVIKDEKIIRSFGTTNRQREDAMKKVLIGGIGNVLLADDGVGPYVVRLLAARYEFEEGVAVEDLGTPALDLIHLISGKDAVMLIDSVAVDAAPGTVLLYRKSDIVQHRPAVRLDPHSPALLDCLHNVELFAAAPKEVLLVGIVGGDYGAGCSLSAAVAASCTRVVEEVLRELDRVGETWKERKPALDPGLGWTPVGEVEHRMTGAGPHQTRTGSLPEPLLQKTTSRRVAFRHVF